MRLSVTGITAAHRPSLHYVLVAHPPGVHDRAGVNLTSSIVPPSRDALFYTLLPLFAGTKLGSNRWRATCIGYG
jgi:hypothetical protein